MGLEMTTEALDFLGNVGYDPVYGARPLKRALQQYLENPLDEKILDGTFGPGDTIQVDVADGQLVFSARPTETAAEVKVGSGSPDRSRSADALVWYLWQHSMTVIFESDCNRLRVFTALTGHEGDRWPRRWRPG